MQRSRLILTTLIIAHFLVAVSAYGQKKENYRINYKSGKLQAESIYDSTCKCDNVTEYYESGKTLSKKTFLHTGFETQINADDYRYFENGNIEIYYFWKNGAPDGRIYCNYPNGILAYEKFFTEKYKSGTWTVYNDDGTIKEELIFTDKKTPWDSNDDYALQKFYLHNKLVYTVDLTAGKKEHLKVVDTKSYNNLMSDNPVTGKQLFMQNCSMCHSSDKDIVGPAVRGVTARRTNDWLMQMITNGSVLIKSGDKDAEDLYEKWYRVEHPNFERLSKDEVSAIIDYLKTLK
jgi:antitoxin component YwqK of YwqJK toxin-antitoxin module